MVEMTTDNNASVYATTITAAPVLSAVRASSGGRPEAISMGGSRTAKTTAYVVKGWPSRNSRNGGEDEEATRYGGREIDAWWGISRGERLGPRRGEAGSRPRAGGVAPLPALAAIVQHAAAHTASSVKR